MSVRIRTITFDAGPDHYAVGRFWAELLGYGDVPGNPNHPDDPETVIIGPDGGPAILFLPVPEPKTVKNRVHLDLEPENETRDEAVQRALRLGATQVADHRNPDGSGFVQLADPAGNEFCIEGSAAERARFAQPAT
ncbi:VOC family protein [Microlunatus parietis]|uniref:Glyoxalase-like domain-containing protein n=1 Tax=Microlunatus parietis TaxID=682979 RepID=A0A7Y9I254_9ACTN|nr:VOC family protein [Microlunatus parietis]NYE68831.1 hypothetical protein [Microlunatus parietis]